MDAVVLASFLASSIFAQAAPARPLLEGDSTMDVIAIGVLVAMAIALAILVFRKGYRS